MFALQIIGAEHKCVFYVCYSFRGRELCLAHGVVSPSDGVSVDGQPSDAANAFCQFDALVVATPHLSAFGYRYGQYDIYVVKEMCVAETLHHERCHVLAQFGAVVVF